MNAETPRTRRIGVRPDDDTPEARALREKQWLDENKEAIESANAYIEKYGLPLEKYRMF